MEVKGKHISHVESELGYQLIEFVAGQIHGSILQ
jgi:hypothetical protein